MRQIFVQQLGEEIREIEGFPGYWASNLGRIISAPKGHQNYWIVLRPGLRRDGYHQVILCIEGHTHSKLVHDLVGRAFNDFSGPGTQWRHSPDKDQMNNRSDNLIWGSSIEDGWDKIVDHGNQDDWGIFPSGSKRNPFRLRIRLVGKQKNIGCFPTKEDARYRRDFFCAFHGLKNRLAA